MTHPIVQCARSYIGTRFHHQGRLKRTPSHKGGIDCLGLLVGVAREVNIKGRNGEMLADFDANDYPHQPDTVALRARLSMLLQKVETIMVGDIALFDIDGAPQHMGIISECEGGLGLIHAYAPARAVVEHALDAYWQKKLVGIYRTISSF
jgi:cell wall-associated NlpC family hydrolase